jgi:hypothetical protein
VSLDDFIAGYYRAVLSRAESVNVTKDDLPSAKLTQFTDTLTAFYNANATDIESAPGVDGMTKVSVSYQCGFEFGRMQMRISRAPTVASEREWGAALAASLTTAARAEAPLKIRRGGDGTVSVEERQIAPLIADGDR